MPDEKKPPHSETKTEQQVRLKADQILNAARAVATQRILSRIQKLIIGIGVCLCAMIAGMVLLTFLGLGLKLFFWAWTF